ncbi:MAG: NAD(P)-binding protein, partial [Janthinobacterium sp.]
MQHARIIIIGAGLSGLYAAHLLERLGVANVVVLEARDF